MAQELTARAEHHTDWHVFVDDPDRGPLGYCTGTGPDTEFDPVAAARVLEADGWRMTGMWRQTPPSAEAPYTVTVVRAPGQEPGEQQDQEQELAHWWDAGTTARCGRACAGRRVGGLHRQQRGRARWILTARPQPLT